MRAVIIINRYYDIHYRFQHAIIKSEISLAPPILASYCFSLLHSALGMTVEVPMKRMLAAALTSPLTNKMCKVP